MQAGIEIGIWAIAPAAKVAYQCRMTPQHPAPSAPPAPPAHSDPGASVDLPAAIAALSALHRQAIAVLTPVVQEILDSSCRDVDRIEHTLDGLLDHAGCPDGVALFKRLCRHYWPLDPQATAAYVNAYREMWDVDDPPDPPGPPPPRTPDGR